MPSFRFLLIGLIAAALAASMNAEAAEKIGLKAALYEFIPGYSQDQLGSLRSSIKKKFEAENPDIDLDLADTGDPFKLYDLNVLDGWLRSGREGGGYDVMELDTLILGELVDRNLIQDWRLDDRTPFFDLALQASTVDGKLYGIPHLLCGHFIFARSDGAVKAKNVAELLAALNEKSNDAIPNLIGEYTGNWNLPALYVDAWIDSYPSRQPADALSAPVDSTVVETMKPLVKLCDLEVGNPCFDEKFGVYDDGVHLARAFGLGFANALMGFSERLHHILKAKSNGEGLRVASAQLGNGSKPIMFADSFVLSRRCEGKCADAAQKFVKFMNRRDVLEDYLMARDMKGETPPRYLLPAARIAFDAPSIAADPFYPLFKPSIEAAVAFPNRGFVGAREAIEKSVRSQLER